MAKLDPKIRPGAGGHRFGPDLQCTECGRYWEAHQREPQPCSSSRSSRLDAFASSSKAEAAKIPGSGERDPA